MSLDMFVFAIQDEEAHRFPREIVERAFAPITRDVKARDYGETRFNTLGEIEGRVFCVSFTRRGEALRVISFRKANDRETGRYRDYLRERSAGGEN